MDQQVIVNGGLQYIPQLAAVQYVYLDFDGELTSYNGEILTVDNVEVKDSELSEERIQKILAELNTKYASQHVIFVTDRQVAVEYSTIYIGKTDAFNQYGNFAGLAETIDEGNQNSTDKAFAMLDAADSNERIIEVISHETDHLLGTLDHGGDGLEAYAETYYIYSGVTSTGIVLNAQDYMYIYNGGVANNTTVNYGHLHIESGGAANSTLVSSDGCLFISSGGIANSTTVHSNGSMCIYSGGIANSTTVMLTGKMLISGGVASDTFAHGSVYIHSGGVHRGNFYIDTAFPIGGGLQVDSGSVIDFTVAGRSTSDDFTHNTVDYLLYTASKVFYTITVDADQQYGCYKLIKDANILPGIFSTITIGDDSVKYGDLSLFGEPLEYGNKTYSLHLISGSELILKIVPDLNNVNDTYILSENDHHPAINITDGGIVYVLQKSCAENVTVNTGGNLYVAMAGQVENVTINGGTVNVATGGIVSDVTIIADGKLFLYGGAILDGVINVNGTVILNDLAVNNGTLNFMLNSDRSDTPVINNMAYLSGGSYTASVDNASNGQYLLAQNANNFNSTLTIQDETGTIGVLQTGETFVHNNTIYSLTISAGNLTLTVRDQLSGNANGVTWNNIAGTSYIVEYSTNNFVNALCIETSNIALDSFGLNGTYQWRLQVDNVDYFNGEDIAAVNPVIPQRLISDNDGNMDLFFTTADGKWADGYAAQHLGILDGWSGTNEQKSLAGKNKLADIFEGSTDANVLVLTDDSNGDALFVDDIYTALPGSVVEQQARITKINEIRAGAGNDIVDMTSQQFSYNGNGVTIYGGLGNDTIWANGGENILFGDAGNDRIVGGSDNDVIVGGIGNDSLHGGGGDDIFCFGENWGNDTVEQLAGDSVTLWFESGSASNWNASTLTYTDGTNSVSVQVSGVADITLRFGADASLPAGCFDDAASEKIFEDKNKSFLA